MREIECIFIFLIINILVSCISTKKLTEGESVLSNDISMLNGTYDNKPADYAGPREGTPLYDLFFNPFRKYYNTEKESLRDYSGKIRIKAIAANKLKVEYVLGDSVVRTKTFKGSVNNNHFVMSRKIKYFGLPPFLWRYDERKIAIGFTEANYLKIAKGEDFSVGIMPIGAT